MNLEQLIKAFRLVRADSGKEEAVCYLRDMGCGPAVIGVIVENDGDRDAWEVRFVAPRYEDPRYAIITAIVTNPDLKEETNFLAELRRAVTEWVKTTEDGRACYEYAGGDLNIGDLLSHGGVEDVVALMPDVVSLDLDQIGAIRSGDWTYDTTLVNGDELDDTEGSQG
tara:strand:- start:174 stop:677 length:504 start_codon:yes stop_codon:yes gene_type:complete